MHVNHKLKIVGDRPKSLDRELPGHLLPGKMCKIRSSSCSTMMVIIFHNGMMVAYSLFKYKILKTSARE